MRREERANARKRQLDSADHSLEQMEGAPAQLRRIAEHLENRLTAARDAVRSAAEEDDASMGSEFEEAGNTCCDYEDAVACAEPLSEDSLWMPQPSAPEPPLNKPGDWAAPAIDIGYPDAQCSEQAPTLEETEKYLKLLEEEDEIKEFEAEFEAMEDEGEEEEDGSDREVEAELEAMETEDEGKQRSLAPTSPAPASLPPASPAPASPGPARARRQRRSGCTRPSRRLWRQRRGCWRRPIRRL